MAEIKKKAKQAEFTKWFGPLLNAVRELGGSGRPKEVVEEIAKAENVSDEKREEVMKSGILRFDNQVAWARQYLVWEGLLENSKKGIWTLSSKGQDTYLTIEDARAIFLKWVEIHQKAKKAKTPSSTIVEKQNEEEPEELDHELTPTLLEVLQSVSPQDLSTSAKDY